MCFIHCSSYTSYHTNPFSCIRRHSSEGKPPLSVYLIGRVVHVISHESFFLYSETLWPQADLPPHLSVYSLWVCV